MIRTGGFRAQIWFKSLAAVVALAPSFAIATDDHIRLDKSQVTINIDWQGHVTGNDPINVYISRTNGGAGCTRVSNASILVERPPLSCSGEFNPTNSCYGGGLHEPIAIAGVWTQAHTPTSLCNVNESDVWNYAHDNAVVAQPSHFYPFPNIDSNPEIENLAHYPYISIEGDGKTLLDPVAFCNQMGRPGSWSHDYVVRMIWDPHWGGTGFFQGIINFLNEVPTQSGFDLSWTNDSNSGKADTQFTATINCLAPPTPTMTYTLLPDSVNVVLDANANIAPVPQVYSVLNYSDPACTKTMSAGAVFGTQILNTPGGAPIHGTTTLLGSGQPVAATSSGSGCTSQTIVGMHPVLPSQAALQCKDASNSGKTLVRTLSMSAQLCASGNCGTSGTADFSKATALTVNLSCPVVITDPAANKGPVGVGKPMSVGNVPASVGSRNPAGNAPAEATPTPAAPGETAPKPADDIEIPATKPKP